VDGTKFNSQLIAVASSKIMDGAGGVPKNPAQGVRNFLSAANHGYVLACGYLGHFYKHGIGVQQNWPEAEQWYRKGAEQGDPGSQNDLAVLLLDGGNGVRKDPSEALKWAKMANQQDYPSAFNLLAHIKAASQPQRKEPGQDSFEEGGQLYRSGHQAAAAKPFLAAAQAGNSLAQLQIGWHYEKGVGVSQNYAEAARWYRKSAGQGNSAAMKNLGQLYEEGTGVPEDWVEAAKWYQQSAELANADGEAALGRAYQFGIGVPLSRKMSIVWDERAAQGNQEAAFFARHLKGGNNLGFRNGQERNVFPGMEILPIYNEWTGVLFHNSAERMSYLLAARREYDQGVAAIGRAQYMQKLNEYQACKSAGGTNCSPPYRLPQ
jgi:TPR repeat protein